MLARSFRTCIVRACAATALLLAATATSAPAATILATDGFGDGDRDNNGLDTGATATDPADVGLPWYLTSGTSAVTFRAIDDSAGIGTGNALQLFNTGSNNRPSVGRLASPITLADGELLTLRFDLRLLSTTNITTGTATTVDRGVRFGIYHDTLNDFVAGDQSSTSTMYNDEVGYNARVDAGNDVSNMTSMDVTRDDTPTGTALIQATTTGIGVASTNAADKLDDTLSHHFEMTLRREGSGLRVTLQQDSNPAISNVDATPTGFTFQEIAFGVRSNAAMDIRVDNIEISHDVPEPTALAALGLAAGGLIARRKRR